MSEPTPTRGKAVVATRTDNPDQIDPDRASPELTLLRTEVGELKNGTAGLVKMVSTLAEALTSLGALESRQEKTDLEVEKTKAGASANRASIERLDEVRALDDRRTFLLRLLIFGLMSLILAALIIGGLTIVRYRQDQHRLAQYVVTNCNIRNGLAEASFANAERQVSLLTGLLAQQDRKGVLLNDPNRLLLQSVLDGLPSKPAVIDCLAYAQHQVGPSD